MPDGRVEIEVTANASQVSGEMRNAESAVRQTAQQTEQAGNTVTRSVENVAQAAERTGGAAEGMSADMLAAFNRIASGTDGVSANITELASVFSEFAERSAEQADRLYRSLSSIEAQISDVGGASEQAMEAAQKKAGIAGGVFKTVAAAIGSATVAAGALAVSLGKEAVSAYAEYEQLAGGVKTLFKDSSDVVLRYAEEAYKTAGVSASAYLETVTGFSASLIQSLGDDTQAAADKANMALIDMSDNASKMGTDIESIRNAYQGFAKGNMTMLDNLKLGYGGTKEEMQRLLDKAEEISGVKFDISSYADIVDAIHVIQTEMGITGTTAIEAEKTVSGSIGMLKASLADLAAGFGNPDADIQKLCDNMSAAFQSVTENIVPVVENIANTLPAAAEALLGSVDELLPGLLDAVTGLFDTVLTSLLEMLPGLAPAAASAVVQIVDTIADNLPLLIEAAVQLVVTLAQGLTDALPQLIPSIVDGVLMAATTLLENVDIILDALVKLVAAVCEGAVNEFPTIIARLPELMASLGNAIISLIPLLLNVPVEICKSIADGLTNFDWQETAAEVFDGLEKRLSEQADRIRTYFADLFRYFGMESAAAFVEGSAQATEHITDNGGTAGGGGWASKRGEEVNAETVAEEIKPKVASVTAAANDEIEEQVERVNKVTDEFKAAYENLQMQLINGDIAEGEAYFSELEKLLSDHNAEGLSAYNKYFKEIKDGRDKLAKEQQKILDDEAKAAKKAADKQAKDAKKKQDELDKQEKERIKKVKAAAKEEISETKKTVTEIVKTYQSKMKEVNKQIDSYKKKLLSVGDAFSVEETTDKFGNKLTKRKIADFDAQIKAMEDYDKKIRQLKAQGASDSFIAELMSSNDMEDGAAFADYISGLSEADRNKIFEGYKAREEAAKKLSENMYADKVSEIENGFISEIEAAFGEMPEGMRELGASAIEAFIDGLSGGDVIGKVSEKADEIFSSLSDAAANGVFNSLDSLLNVDDAYYDELAAKVEAIVEAQSSAVSSAISARAITVNVEGGQAAQSQTYTKGELDRLIAELSKPVVLQIDGKAIAEFTIGYANRQGKITGGAVIR